MITEREREEEGVIVKEEEEEEKGMECDGPEGSGLKVTVIFIPTEEEVR